MTKISEGFSRLHSNTVENKQRNLASTKRAPVLGDPKSKIEEKETPAQSRNHASLFSTVHGIIYQQRQTIQNAPCNVPLPPPGQKQMMDSNHLKYTTTKRPTRRISPITYPKINNLRGVHKRGFPPARIYN